MTIAWLVVSFNYYLIGFLMKYFPGNIYVNGLSSGSSEILSVLFGGLMYGKLGVKISFYIFFGMAFVGGLGILIYEDASQFFSPNPVSYAYWIFPTLVMFTKFGIAAAFTVLYFANADCFPVLFSATALGFGNFLARLITIFSSQVAEIQTTLPMLIFTSLCILTISTAPFIRVMKHDANTTK